MVRGPVFDGISRLSPVLRGWVFPLLLLAAANACDEVGNPVSVEDPDGDQIIGSADQCPNQAETVNGVFDSDGCPDTVSEFHEVVRQDVESMWADRLASIGIPYVPLQWFVEFQGAIQTRCGVATGPFYCGPDAGVFLERGFMLAQLHRVGDFANAVIIAHEIGHHLQWLAGILGTVPSIQLELQADCLAGTWARTAGNRGLLEPGDLQEASVALFSVGDPAGTPWFHPSAHGSPQQRVAAFHHGYSGGPC